MQLEDPGGKLHLWGHLSHTFRLLRRFLKPGSPTWLSLERVEISADHRLGGLEGPNSKEQSTSPTQRQNAAQIHDDYIAFTMLFERPITPFSKVFPSATPRLSWRRRKLKSLMANRLIQISVVPPQQTDTTTLSLSSWTLVTFSAWTSLVANRLSCFIYKCTREVSPLVGRCSGE